MDSHAGGLGALNWHQLLQGLPPCGSAEALWSTERGSAQQPGGSVVACLGATTLCSLQGVSYGHWFMDLLVLSVSAGSTLYFLLRQDVIQLRHSLPAGHMEPVKGGKPDKAAPTQHIQLDGNRVAEPCLRADRWECRAPDPAVWCRGVDMRTGVGMGSLPPCTEQSRAKQKTQPPGCSQGDSLPTASSTKDLLTPPPGSTRPN